MEKENHEERSRKKRFKLINNDEPIMFLPNDDPMYRESESQEELNDFGSDFPIVHLKDEYENRSTVKKPTRGRPKKKTETLEWSDDATELLIELWQAKGELYDKGHPHFYSREVKDKAVEDIKDTLISRGYYVTTNQILSKFQSLRTYFCSQRTKLSHSKRTSGAHGDTECKWRFFKHLHFLDDNMKPREGYAKRHYEEENAHSPFYLRSMVGNDEVNVPREYSDHASDNSFSTKNDSSRGQAQPSIQNPSKNDDQLFGDLIGNMMTQLPAGQYKDLLKLDIQQMIIKAKYSCNSNDDKTANGNAQIAS